MIETLIIIYHKSSALTYKYAWPLICYRKHSWDIMVLIFGSEGYYICRSDRDLFQMSSKDTHCKSDLMLFDFMPDFILTLTSYR